MPEPVVLTPEQYWELRTRLLEHQALVKDSQQAIAESSARLNALLTEVGLDPKTPYQLTDADLSATVRGA